MKGTLIKIKDKWHIKYTNYKTIPGVKGVMGSHSRIPESNYIPLHPDNILYVSDGDEGITVDFEKTQEESGVYNDYKVTWYAKLINEEELFKRNKQEKHTNIKIKHTAEDVMIPYLLHDNDDVDLIKSAMVEFAKLHVELALESAAEKLPHDDRLNQDMIVKQSILNSYPLTNIK